MENTMTAADIASKWLKIEAERSLSLPENETQEGSLSPACLMSILMLKSCLRMASRPKTAAQFHDELEMFCNDNECDLSEHTDFKRHLPVIPSHPSHQSPTR